MNPIYTAIVQLQSEGGMGALCTIIESSGSTPRHVGSKMLVFEDGHFIGTVGGGEVEIRVIHEALDSMLSGNPRRLQYAMVDPKRGDPGVCGGSLEVYVEPILPEPLLVVIGGGHVGKAVAHLAKWLGFRVAVSDDRAEFCTQEANPSADEFFPVAMAELPAHLRFNAQTFLVLTTRSAAVDIAGLPKILEQSYGYLGVIGSKRRWSVTRKALLENGISEEKLTRIHAPIGLELNAETPEEIAVSIMAEIIMLRNQGTGGSMKAQA
jgi:xanthine dehydrogenase accessory factor